MWQLKYLASLVAIISLLLLFAHAYNKTKHQDALCSEIHKHKGLSLLHDIAPFCRIAAHEQRNKVLHFAHKAYRKVQCSCSNTPIFHHHFLSFVQHIVLIPNKVLDSLYQFLLDFQSHLWLVCNHLLHIKFAL